MTKAILTDLSKCIGCRACVMACKEKNGLPMTDDVGLSWHTYTTIREKGGLFIRRLCMHCEDPACASVCPVGALRKTEAGPVTYDEDKCIGCRYCMLACPFGIPKYEWNSMLPRVRKCDMCADRIAQGKQPACTEACPVAATIFGDRDKLIKEARGRINSNSGAYVDHIYGEFEVGGTSSIFISPASFSSLIFRGDLKGEPLPMLTWKALSKIPDIVVIGGVILGGVWWVINRRMELEKTKGEEGSKSGKGARENDH